jgi:hypothetical protein
MSASHTLNPGAGRMGSTAALLPPPGPRLSLCLEIDLA